MVFTEVGYCSGRCKRDHTPDAAGCQKHAYHYSALLEAFRNECAWFLGSVWWNWNTDPGRSVLNLMNFVLKTMNVVLK